MQKKQIKNDKKQQKKMDLKIDRGTGEDGMGRWKEVGDKQGE